jgi:hypothetical protein
VALGYNRVLLVQEAFMPQAVKPATPKHHLQSRQAFQAAGGQVPLSPKEIPLKQRIPGPLFEAADLSRFRESSDARTRRHKSAQGSCFPDIPGWPT